MDSTATRLLPYTGRQLDHHARRTASEAAADTASLIFYEVCWRYLVLNYPNLVVPRIETDQMAIFVLTLALALTMMNRMLTMIASVLIVTDPVLATALILILATILVLVLALPNRLLCLALATLQCQVAHILRQVTLVPASIPVSRLDHTHLLTEGETWQCQFMQRHILRQLYRCQFPV